VSRFLICTLPLAGHAYPALAVSQALSKRGHDVAWAGSEAYFRPLAGEDARIYRTGTRLYRPQAERGIAALKSLWQGYLIPFARFTATAVGQAAEDYQPDVMLVDQHTLAGSLTAHQRGLRWATLITQAMELTRPFRALPRVEAWVDGQLAALCRRAGLPEQGFHPLFSPDLVLACTSTALAGPHRFPAHHAFVGPLMGDRPMAQPFPWDRLVPGTRRILVTVGTLATDIAADFYGRVAAALRLAGEGVQAIVVGPPEALASPPPGVIAVTRAPFLGLLPHLDAVICHGGHNVTSEALAHGLPLVVAPIRHDQPVVAAQVAAAGAGIRVRFGRSGPAELAAALTAVLDDGRYRAAAAKIAESFRNGGGAVAAAERLERLAER
jgi:zeaxanthin glucosyltransferase